MREVKLEGFTKLYSSTGFWETIIFCLTAFTFRSNPIQQCN